MSPAEFDARVPELLRALGRATTRELADACLGISAHTAHGRLRDLEDRRVIVRVGFQRGVVWGLPPLPPVKP